MAPAAAAKGRSPEGFGGEEVVQFKLDGFVIARRLAGKDVCERMREVTRLALEKHLPPLELEAELAYPGAPGSTDTAGGRTIRRLKMALARDPVFVDFVSSPALADRLQQLLGPHVIMPLVHHNCIMTKRPQYSSDTGWHQDIRYWAFERPELISVWLALGDEFPDNGGLSVIPGSHREAVERTRLDTELFLDARHPENHSLIERAVSLTLEAGDVLFFHCRLFHSATRNHAGRQKYSVVFTFRPDDNPPIPGSRSASLPELIIR